MSTVLRNVRLMPECGFGQGSVDVRIDGARIAEIAPQIALSSNDTVVEGRGDLLLPGFVNTHCHAAMTLFRGYGEDLPLSRWLNERIFPAEDRLTAESVYWGSMLAIAEMLRNGITSFSDMYFFCDSTARAVLESGIKANLSRSLVSFAPAINLAEDTRFAEAVALVKEFHGAGDGRIRVDMSLHAEYTNQPDYCAAVGAYTVKHGLGMQLHLSETEDEHNACIARHGKTPAAFSPIWVFLMPPPRRPIAFGLPMKISPSWQRKVSLRHTTLQATSSLARVSCPCAGCWMAESMSPWAPTVPLRTIHWMFCVSFVLLPFCTKA